MQEFQGKTAMVTGAASGIGLGMARSFARAGMNVVLCDIRAEPLAEALAQVNRLGAQGLAVVTDVSERAALQAAAEQAVSAFGAIHVACNNAGVAMHGKPIEALSETEWDWVMGVNIRGVINGMQVFLPHIRAQGGEGHIVNTASIGGFQVHPGWHTGAYSMTKYAVVALSEAIEQDLADTPIGVSVLCPAAVATHIFATADSRPARLGGPYARAENEAFAALVKDGLDGDTVGRRVMRAIRRREFYVFTHAGPREWIERRHARIQAAFDECREWRIEEGLAPEG